MPRKTLKEIARKADDYDSRDRYKSLEEMLEDFNPPKPRRDYSKVRDGFVGVGHGISNSYSKLCDRLSDSYRYGLISDFRNNLGIIVKWIGIAGVSFSLVFSAIKGYPILMNSRAEAKFNQYKNEFVLVQQDVASGNYESADARAEAIMQKMIKDGHKGVPELLEEIVRYDDEVIDPQTPTRVVIREEGLYLMERGKERIILQDHIDYHSRSPNSKHIAFITNRTLYVIKSDGTGLKKLDSEIGESRFYLWDYVGWLNDQTVEFNRFKDSRGNAEPDGKLYVINIDGTGLKEKEKYDVTKQ